MRLNEAYKNLKTLLYVKESIKLHDCGARVTRMTWNLHSYSKEQSLSFTASKYFYFIDDPFGVSIYKFFSNIDIVLWEVIIVMLVLNRG